MFGGSMITRRLLSSLGGSCIVVAVMGCNALVGNEDIDYTDRSSGISTTTDAGPDDPGTATADGSASDDASATGTDAEAIEDAANPGLDASADD